MPEAFSISAEARDRAGKGAARAMRRAGRVPAVIYGNKQTPVLITLDPIELHQQLRNPGFFAHIFEVKVNGDAHRVLARDVQYDPVTDRPLHVDFMRFSAKTRININVAVQFINEEECPGLKLGSWSWMLRSRYPLRRWQRPWHPRRRQPRTLVRGGHADATQRKGCQTFPPG